MNERPLAFWSIAPAEMPQQLQTAQEGLTSDEARQRIARYGANLLKPPRRSDQVFGFSQLPISFSLLIRIVIMAYIVTAEVAKTVFYKKLRV